MIIDKGDVLLTHTVDGSEINVENGIIEMTTGFETYVYLCLFGGNSEDNGTASTKKIEWWGNKLETNNPERKLTSRFQNILFGLPATPANLIKLKQAAEQDLSGLTADKIADTIQIDLRIVAKNRIEGEIVILKDKIKLFETTFQENWLGQAVS